MNPKEDEEWVPEPIKLKENSNDCIIHCTDAKGDLTSIESLESWTTLLNAATIHKHQAVLEVASTLADGDVPAIKYHRNCRSIFTIKKLLDNIKSKENVSLTYFLCSKITNGLVINKQNGIWAKHIVHILILQVPQPTLAPRRKSKRQSSTKSNESKTVLPEILYLLQ